MDETKPAEINITPVDDQDAVRDELHKSSGGADIGALAVSDDAE